MSLESKYLGCRTVPSLPEICPRAEPRATVVILEVSVTQEIRIKTEFPLTVCRGFSHTTPCGYQAGPRALPRC